MPAAIWAQRRRWCLRAAKRSQQSNLCAQISAIPQGKKKTSLRNPCFTLLSQRVTIFVAIAHAASVEGGRLPEGWWGVEGGAGRLLRRIPGPDVVPLSPSPDDLWLSWWFVPMTAMSSVWAGTTFCGQMPWMKSTQSGFFVAVVLMIEENILLPCVH